jgi:selenoprotein W-related protein
LHAVGSKIKEIELVPSAGGRFEVSANGDLIYSKLATGRHADPHEIIASVRKLVNKE